MKSYPFDSKITGYEADGAPIYDRAADSTVLANWMRRYFSDGVFVEKDTQAPGWQVLSGDGLTVTVSVGACTIQGRFAYEENERTLTFDAADASLPRIDTVALRCNLENDVRDIDLVVIPGTPASAPQAPALTRNQSIYDLGIADVTIAANSTEIAQTAILDTRLDTSRCGIVCVPMQTMDTDQFYEQIRQSLTETETAYYEKLQLLQEALEHVQDGSAWVMKTGDTMTGELKLNVALAIASGGTGGKNAAEARTNLDVYSKAEALPRSAIVATTTDPGAGATVEYTDGTVIHVYE